MTSLLSFNKSGDLLVSWAPLYVLQKDTTFKLSNGDISDTNVYFQIAANILDLDSFMDLGDSQPIGSVNLYCFAGSGQTIYAYGSNTGTTSGFILLGSVVHNAGWRSISVSDTNPYRYLRFRASSPGGYQINEIEVYGIANGSLNISSTPSGAEIFIDNIDKGATTQAIISGITPGEHAYKLTLAGGYYDVIGTFNINEATTTYINVNIYLISTTGIVIGEPVFNRGASVFGGIMCGRSSADKRKSSR